MWKFFCVLCQDGLKQWNLEKIFKDCGAAHKKHGCFRSMFNVSSHFTAALLARLNLFTLYSLISERLAWISKGKPIVFDLQQLLTRTFSTQPASDFLKRLFASSPSQTRSRFEATRSEVHELMKRIREAPQEYRQTSPISCEGYLYVQEKRKKFVLQMSFSFSWYVEVVWPGVSTAWFLQDHLPLGQVGSNVTVHLSKSRRSCTWWPSTTDLVGSLWVATEHIKHLTVFTISEDPLV